MSNFNFLSYTTVYSTQYKDAEFDILRDRACFGETLRSIQFNLPKEKVCISYEIYICMDEEGIEHGISNYCPLSPEAMLAYIHNLQELQPFFCTVDFNAKFPTYFNKYDWKSITKLNVTIDAEYVQHKFVLTALRYLWEYPFNIELFDAIRVNKQFPQHNILVLHHLVMTTLRRGDSIHQLGKIGYIPRIVTNETIQNALAKSIEVNNIYTDISVDVDTLNGFTYAPKDLWNSTEVLFNQQKQKDRDEIYKKNIKIIWETSAF